MDAHLIAKRGPRTDVWAAFALWIGLGLLAGCGGSPDPSATVTPGTEATIDVDDATVNPPETPSLEAPGGMQLPANATIDMPTKTINEPKPGGFTLPSDADSQTSRKPPVDSAAPVSSTTPADSTARAIDVQFADWDTIAAKAKSGGKVTVIDLWSLSCEPCLKEFPGLVRLQETHGDKVQCIAANVDFDGRKRRPPEYYQESVEAFLSSVDADGVASYICSTPSDEVFEATEIISIPTVLIYDAEGKQIHKFVDAGETIGFTYEKDIEPLIKKLAQ